MAAPLVAGTAALLRAPSPNSHRATWSARLSAQRRRRTGDQYSAGDAAAVVETCSMDVDGDGQVLPTTDGLIIMRAMMGMTGTAVSNAATATAARNTWDSIRNYLKNVCLMNLP